MAEYQYINCRNLLSLPNEIASVFSTLGVPPRLYAHSLLVHDVANKLLEKLNGTWKNLNINKDLVLFGALHSVDTCFFFSTRIGGTALCCETDSKVV